MMNGELEHIVAGPATLRNAIKMITLHRVPHLRSGISYWFEALGLPPRLHCAATL